VVLVLENNVVCLLPTIVVFSFYKCLFDICKFKQKKVS